MNTDRDGEFQILYSKFQTGAASSAPTQKSSASPQWTLRLCIFICVVFVVAVAAQQAKAPAEKLDLNTATVEQLDTLPEVGPALAKAIVRFREKSGPFRRVEDLLAVPGISKRRLEKIRPLVEVKEVKK